MSSISMTHFSTLPKSMKISLIGPIGPGIFPMVANRLVEQMYYVRKVEIVSCRAGFLSRTPEDSFLRGSPGRPSAFPCSEEEPADGGKGTRKKVRAGGRCHPPQLCSRRMGTIRRATPREPGEYPCRAGTRQRPRGPERERRRCGRPTFAEQGKADWTAGCGTAREQGPVGGPAVRRG